MGYPAPEVWGGFYVWTTRRRTTLAHAEDVVYKDTGSGRPEGGFREPQEWKSRLTGDLETWRLQRDLDLQITSSHDRQKGTVTLPEVGLP